MKKPTVQYYLLLLLVFIASIAGGYFESLRSNSGIDYLQQTFPFTSLLQSIPAFVVFLFIFFNNAVKVFVALILGAFFGLLLVYFIYTNGYLLGLLAPFVIRGPGWKLLLVGILPHGIIEIAAVFIGSAYGLWLGMKLFRRIFFKEPFNESVRFAFGKFVHLVLPLLLLAAIIEAYVTPTLISYFALK